SSDLNSRRPGLRAVRAQVVQPFGITRKGRRGLSFSMRNPDNENAVVIIPLPSRNMRNVAAERLHKSSNKIVEVNVFPRNEDGCVLINWLCQLLLQTRDISEAEMCIHRKTVFYGRRFYCG